jgi:hypothetical protein
VVSYVHVVRKELSVSALAGRVVSAVGVVCGFLGIWLSAIDLGQLGSESYWNLDGTLGAYLLILTILCALLLAAAATDAPTDLLLGAVGAMLFGTYAFFPAAFATNQWTLLGAGAWLGVCSALIPIGVGLTTRLGIGSPARASEGSLIGRGAAGVGLIMVLVAIFLTVDRASGTYWSVRGAGHSLGILFLIAIAVGAGGLGLGLALHSRPADLVGGAAVFCVLGLALFDPVTSAFGDLGVLRAGAWLAFAGGIVAAAGTVTALRSAPAGGAAPAPALT